MNNGPDVYICPTSRCINKKCGKVFCVAYYDRNDDSKYACKYQSKIMALCLDNIYEKRTNFADNFSFIPQPYWVPMTMEEFTKTYFDIILTAEEYGA